MRDTDLQPRNDPIYIQLLQASDYDTAKIQQCRIKIENNMSLWNVFTHLSGSQWTCHQMHVSGSLLLEHNTLISGLRKNRDEEVYAKRFNHPRWHMQRGTI